MRAASCLLAGVLPRRASIWRCPSAGVKHALIPLGARRTPRQTQEPRRERLKALADAAWEQLGISDLNGFVKTVVWPFCKAGGDLSLVGFYYLEDFLEADVDHGAVEAAVFPEGYAWEDNDPKHQQNREVEGCVL